MPGRLGVAGLGGPGALSPSRRRGEGGGRWGWVGRGRSQLPTRRLSSLQVSEVPCAPQQGQTSSPAPGPRRNHHLGPPRVLRAGAVHPQTAPGVCRWLRELPPQAQGSQTRQVRQMPQAEAGSSATGGTYPGGCLPPTVHRMPQADGERTHRLHEVPHAAAGRSGAEGCWKRQAREQKRGRQVPWRNGKKAEVAVRSAACCSVAGVRVEAVPLSFSSGRWEERCCRRRLR